MKAQALSLVALAGAAAAQSGAYGQCGGINWTGATTCVSGYTCVYQNDWYSQCVPSTSSTTSTTLATTTTSKSTTTTTTTTTTTSSKTTTITSKTTTTSSGSTSTSFPSTSNLNFTIDGVTDYFAGSNSYWISMLTNDADVDLVMSHVASSGLKILRIWGFNDVNTVPSTGTVYFQYLSNGVATINTGTYGLQRLDSVVAAAEKYGVKLIINFVNNWTDYGGMQAYINAFASGAAVTTWYTNTAIQTAYKAYIAAVVSRFSTSDAIFAWELANEPRCNGCATSVLYNWISEISAYIKSLDSKHMVCIGDEGFGLSTGTDGSYPYTYAEGLDFNLNLGISTIDFGTYHLYPDSWGTSYTWGNAWVTNHGAACAAAGKPCMLEEYGVSSNHCSVEAPWQQAAISSTGNSADLFWQWGDTISTGQTSNDGNTIYYGSTDYTCLVTNHVTAINAR